MVQKKVNDHRHAIMRDDRAKKFVNDLTFLLPPPGVIKSPPAHWKFIADGEARKTRPRVR